MHFSEYEPAAKEAQEMADATGREVRLWHVRAFGQNHVLVGFAHEEDALSARSTETFNPRPKPAPPAMDAKRILELVGRGKFESLDSLPYPNRYDLPGAGPGAYVATVDEFEICIDPNAEIGVPQIYVVWGDPAGNEGVWWTAELKVQRGDN